MKNRKKISFMTLVITTIFIFSSLTALGINVNTTSVKDDLSYTGNLRIYIVEPESRWDNYDDNPYHYGFLDFAVNEDLSIKYLDTYTNQVIWDASEAGYSNVRENNILVIASIFSPKSEKEYANPPFQNPFDAHYVDATAGAEPGGTGQNTVNEEFTHTVFVEEATATWCPHCPVMAEALNDVYKSGDYPFYFVAMVADMSQKAEDRLVQDYNLYGYPSSFFDGGYKVLVGGYEDTSYYEARIQQSGSRDVHELDLSIAVEWLGGGDLEIDVSITNNEEITNAPPATPTINGPPSGKAGTEYEYTISSTDPDGDNVYYWISWYEDCPAIYWQGPYSSGEEVVFPYKWNAKGDYTIKVKAKDSEGYESDWATLDVSMPRTHSFSVRLPQRFMDFFPNLSIFIERILG